MPRRNFCGSQVNSKGVRIGNDGKRVILHEDFSALSGNSIYLTGNRPGLPLIGFALNSLQCIQFQRLQRKSYEYNQRENDNLTVSGYGIAMQATCHYTIFSTVTSGANKSRNLNVSGARIVFSVSSTTKETENNSYVCMPSG